MIVVFDLPAPRVAIGAIGDRRIDVPGVMVPAGLLVVTVLGLTSHDVRLYLPEGSVPSVVFALGCPALGAAAAAADFPPGDGVAPARTRRRAAMSRRPGAIQAAAARSRPITMAWGLLPG
jgi:hypothetical protein